MIKLVLYRYLKKKIKTVIHNYINTKYWDFYYKKHRDCKDPSSFAQYCYEKYFAKSEGKMLLELGCGNGRDSLYFMNKNLNVMGLDIVNKQLKYLNSKYKCNNMIFKCVDFSQYSKPDFYDYIYSRFTLHAITEEQELDTLANSFKNLKANGLFFIEVRSIKDDMYKKSYKLSETETKTDHYRRFAIYDKLLDRIHNVGFEILESVESQGLAKYKDEDPCVIRIVAKKCMYDNI